MDELYVIARRVLLDALDALDRVGELDPPALEERVEVHVVAFCGS